MKLDPKVKWPIIFGLVGLLVLLGQMLAKRDAKPMRATTSRASVSSVESSAPGRRRMRAETRRRRFSLPDAEVTHSDDAGIGAFEGRVVTATSLQGIEGVEVVWSGPDDEEAISTTNVDGAFRLQPSVEGAWSMQSVRAVGYIERDFERDPIVLIARQGTGLTGIEVALDPVVHYRGRVVGPADEAIAFATVRILDGERDDSLTTDAQGRFTIAAPEGALLEASHTDYASGRARIDIAAQISKSVVLRLRDLAERQAGATISGEVRDANGNGIGEAQIVATRLDSGTPNLSPIGKVTTDAKGRFAIAGLDAGKYTVTAVKPGFARASKREIIAPAENVVLEMGTGSALTGIVRHQETGEPVVAFTIVLREQTGPLVREVIAAEPFYDEAGFFAIDDVPTEKISVSAVARGLVPSDEVEVELRQGMPSPTHVELELSMGGWVSGEVTSGPGGSLVAGARITVEGQNDELDQGVSFLLSAVTDATGKFHLDGVPYGVTSLFVAAENHHARAVGGIAVPGTVTIDLTPLSPGEDPKIELFGIGAILKAQDDVLLIQQVVPGGGAEQAGLSPGDAVVAIDGVNVTSLGFQGSVNKIRGPEGTVVNLTIRAQGGGGERVVGVKRVRVRA